MDLNKLLKEKLLKLLPKENICNTTIESLRIARIDTINNKPNRCFYKPMISLIISGKKECSIGIKNFSCEEGQYMIVGFDIPSKTFIKNISKESPFLAISLEIDPKIILELEKELLPIKRKDDYFKGIAIANIDNDLLGTALRLLNLLDDNEKNQKILAPMIIKEMYYRILIGPIGDKLRSLNNVEAKSNKIAQVIMYLKDNYEKALNIKDLAKSVNMTPTTFYRHFKKMTNFSPLQYQKQLRLYIAHNLITIDNQNATNTAYMVGYESVTQFNREYKRIFGEPPIRSIKKLQ